MNSGEIEGNSNEIILPFKQKRRNETKAAQRHTNKNKNKLLTIEF